MNWNAILFSCNGCDLFGCDGDIFNYSHCNFLNGKKIVAIWYDWVNMYLLQEMWGVCYGTITWFTIQGIIFLNFGML